MKQYACDIEIGKYYMFLYGPYNTFIYSIYDKGRKPKIIEGYLRRK